MSHGLWYFPSPPARAPPKAQPSAEEHRQNRSVNAARRQEGYDSQQKLLAELTAQRKKDINNNNNSKGDGGRLDAAVFEQQAWAALQRRVLAQTNRCTHCWFDKAQSCICDSVPRVSLQKNVRVIVLMHYKEYFRASDDAKLLPMMLPTSQCRLLIFGRPGDLAALNEEIDADPTHAMMLWPGDQAYTVEQFVAALPPSSPWRGGDNKGKNGSSTATSSPLPVLRVIVLDAVYRHARMMFRHICKMRTGGCRPLRHVALHPQTLSVYSRAQNGYAQASAASVASSADPDALRICTVEAFALLLSELGEPSAQTRELVTAVLANNEGLRKGPRREQAAER